MDRQTDRQMNRQTERDRQTNAFFTVSGTQKVVEEKITKKF